MAQSFQLIEDDGRPVIIPWDKEGEALCTHLRKHWVQPDRFLLRKLQRYTVQLSSKSWMKHAGKTIELVHNRYPVLSTPELYYSEHTGLQLDEEVSTALIV